MKSIVVAYDQKRGIGADNDLLWLRDLPADLKHFKELTMGHAILMGRNTFESIGRPLPGRRTIVLTHHRLNVPDITTVDNLEEAFRLGGETIDVIGGGQVYQQVLPLVDIIYATEVMATFFQATVFFPELDMYVWQEVSRAHHDADEKNKYPFDFVEYRKRQP